MHPDSQYVTRFVPRPQQHQKKRDKDDDYCPSSSLSDSSETDSFGAYSISTESCSSSNSSSEHSEQDDSSKTLTAKRQTQASTTVSSGKSVSRAGRDDFGSDLLNNGSDIDQEDLAFADDVPFNAAGSRTPAEVILLREYPSLACLHVVIQKEKASRSIKENRKNSVALALQAFHNGEYCEAITILKDCIADDPRAYSAFEMLASFYESIIRDRLYVGNVKLSKLLHVYNKPQAVAENILLTASLEFQLASAILQPKAESFLTLITDFLKFRRLSKALYCLHKLLPLFVSGLDDIYCNNILERDSQILAFERDMVAIFDRYIASNPESTTSRDRGILLSFSRKICTYLMHAPYVEGQALEFLDKITAAKLGTVHRSYRISERITFLMNQQLRIIETGTFMPSLVSTLFDIMYKARKYEGIIDITKRLLLSTLQHINDKKGTDRTAYKRHICFLSLHRAKAETVFTLQSIASAMRAASPEVVASGTLIIKRMNKTSLLHINNVLKTFYASTYHQEYDEPLLSVATSLLEGLADILWLVRTRNMALIDGVVVNIETATRASKRLTGDAAAQEVQLTQSVDAEGSPDSSMVQTRLDKFVEQFTACTLDLLPQTITTYAETLQARESLSAQHKQAIARLLIINSRVQALYNRPETEIVQHLGMAFKHYKGVEPRKELARFLYTQQMDSQLMLKTAKDPATRAKAEAKRLRGMRMLMDLMHPKISLYLPAQDRETRGFKPPEKVLLNIPLISYPQDYRIDIYEQLQVTVKQDTVLHNKYEFYQEVDCVVATYCATKLQIYSLMSIFSYYLSLCADKGSAKDGLLTVEAFLEKYRSEISSIDCTLLAHIVFMVGFSLIFTDAYMLPANYPRTRYTYKLLTGLRTYSSPEEQLPEVKMLNEVVAKYLSEHPLKIFRNSVLLSLPEDIESCRWEFDLLLEGLVDGNIHSYIAISEIVSRIDFYIFLVELEETLGRNLEGAVNHGVFHRGSVLLSLLFFITDRSSKAERIIVSQKQLARMHLLAKDLIQKTGLVSMQYSYQRSRCFADPNNMHEYKVLIKHYLQADPTLPIGKFLKRIIRRSPDSVPAQFAMAATFFQSSYFQEAIKLYEKLCPLCFSDDIFHALEVTNLDICGTGYEKRIATQRSIQAAICYVLAIAYLHISGNKRIRLKTHHIAMGLRYLQLFAVCNGESKKVTHLAVALVLMYYCHRLDAAEIILQRILRSKYGPNVSGDPYSRDLHLALLPRLSCNALLGAGTASDTSSDLFFDRYLTQKPPPREPYTRDEEQSIMWTAAHALVLIYLTVGSIESANYTVSRYLTFGPP